MPTYGPDVLGIELAAAGAATALVPLAGIVSRPGGGRLSERLGGRLQPVIVTSFIASILLLYLISVAPSPTAFAALLALTGGAVNLAVGLYLVYVNTLADAATQGTSLSVLFTFSQVGNLVAPVAGGWLIAELSWTAGFGFAVALAIVGLATILVAPAASSRSSEDLPDVRTSARSLSPMRRFASGVQYLACTGGSGPITGIADGATPSSTAFVRPTRLPNRIPSAR